MSEFVVNSRSVSERWWLCRRCENVVHNRIIESHGFQFL